MWSDRPQPTRILQRAQSLFQPLGKMTERFRFEQKKHRNCTHNNYTLGHSKCRGICVFSHLADDFHASLNSPFGIRTEFFAELRIEEHFSRFIAISAAATAVTVDARQYCRETLHRITTDASQSRCAAMAFRRDQHLEYADWTTRGLHRRKSSRSSRQR